MSIVERMRGWFKDKITLQGPGSIHLDLKSNSNEILDVQREDNGNYAQIRTSRVHLPGSSTDVQIRNVQEGVTAQFSTDAEYIKVNGNDNAGGIFSNSNNKIVLFIGGLLSGFHESIKSIIGASGIETIINTSQLKIQDIYNQDGGVTLSKTTVTTTLSGAETISSHQIPSDEEIKGIQFKIVTNITFAGGGAKWNADIDGGAVSEIVSERSELTAGLTILKKTIIITDGVANIKYTPDAGTFATGQIKAVIWSEKNDISGGI